MINVKTLFSKGGHRVEWKYSDNVTLHLWVNIAVGVSLGYGVAYASAFVAQGVYPRVVNRWGIVVWESSIGREI